MVFMTSDRVDQQILGENIALLRLLGKEHGKPAKNMIPLGFWEQATSFPRKLRVEREIDLANTLAFLSGSSNDPEKVIAVCIEEQKDGKSMTIRIAANRGGMQPRKEALERMASILEQVASEGELPGSRHQFLD